MCAPEYDGASGQLLPLISGANPGFGCGLRLITLAPRASATEVQSRIEAAFRRSAELDAQKVKVETHNGNVTLRGNVSSWSERRAAERSAWAAPGVTQVDNLIKIAP